MLSRYIIMLVLLVCAMIATVITGKLTVAAALTGGLLGFIIFADAGYTGVAMVATFFIAGTFATSHKITVKQRLGLAEKDKGKRTAGQVIANAGVAGILGLLILLYPGKTTLFELMMAASLASATADTLSSELGNVYGRSFYNIVTFKKDIRGLDGVISVEGTLIGIAGSILIAIVYVLGYGWYSAGFCCIVISGTIGNLSDSFLGATLERKLWLNNNAVNFLNTLVSALAAMLLGWCF